ncbi:MAG: hypothetical protein PHS41_07930 [Victivallaceae bacterium]|nr:hypothetical protein [Victivallaceae bacterium]
MKIRLLPLLCVIASWFIWIAPSAGVEAIRPDGSFVHSKRVFRPVHFDGNWRMTAAAEQNFQCDPGYPRSENGIFHNRGLWRISGGAFRVVERLAPRADGKWDGKIEFSSETAVATRQLGMVVSLPVEQFAGRWIGVDGTPVAIPKERGKDKLAGGQGKHVLFVPGTVPIGIAVTQGFSLLDSRKFAWEFALRLPAAPSNGKITRSELTFTLDSAPFRPATSEEKQATQFASSISEYGVLVFEKEKFRFAFCGDDWVWRFPGKENFTFDPGYPKLAATQWESRGVFRVPGGAFQFHQTICAPDARTRKVTIDLKADRPIRSRHCALYLSLPIAPYAGRDFVLDQAKIRFPVTQRAAGRSVEVLAEKPSFRSLELERRERANRLRITSDSALEVLDARAFGPEFIVRLNLPLEKGTIRQGKLQFTITDLTAEVTPLPLSPVANRAFADPVAGDGKGGWTDQGPHNDFAAVISGDRKIRGVSFHILAPEVKDGKSCLVLPAGKSSPATIRLPQGTRGKQLYLLHAITQAPPKSRIGSLVLNYADKTSTEIPVVAGRDVANWWNPMNLENAVAVCSTRAGDHNIGLMLTSFPVEEKALAALEFRPEPGTSADWMIVAASLGKEHVPLEKTQPLRIGESKQWKKMEFCGRTVPGSILDFSFLLDAPAGKYGFVQNRDGQFVFEKAPEKRLRLYGVNLCFSACFPDHAGSDALAEEFARRGVNAVRFHHHDDFMVKPGTTQLDEAAMDRLDYLFAALKKRGIYLTTDLFCSRNVRKEELNLSRPLDRWNGGYRLLVLLDPRARDNFKSFISNWLNHVNPYTGLAWKDDPALVSCNIVNEGNSDYWSLRPNSSETAALWKQRVLAFSAAEKLPVTAASRPAIEGRFVIALEREFFRDMHGFLRRLGLQIPITNQNMRIEPRLTYMRRDYDYVDMHTYFDHPSGWSLPSTITNTSAISECFRIPGQVFPARIFGKPFTITEMSWVYPNRYRAESGVAAGAYAAFQGASGIYRFAYAHDRKLLENPTPVRNFDTVNDPMNLFADRIGALLFVRGDVAAGTFQIPIKIPESVAKNPATDNYPLAPVPPEMSMASCVGKIGADWSIPAGKAFLDWTGMGGAAAVPVAKLGANLRRFGNPGAAVLDVGRKWMRSSTGELELDGKKGYFKVVTPRSEALILTTPGSIRGDALSVERADFHGVFFASAMDGKTLAKSEKILFLHLTEGLNKGTRFLDPEMKIIDSFGEVPLLARRSRAKITLRTGFTKQPKLQFLRMDGRVLHEGAVAFDRGVVTFDWDNVPFQTEAILGAALVPSTDGAPRSAVNR